MLHIYIEHIRDIETSQKPMLRYFARNRRSTRTPHIGRYRPDQYDARQFMHRTIANPNTFAVERTGLLQYVACDFGLIFFPFGVPQTIDSIPISDGRSHPMLACDIRRCAKCQSARVSVNTAKQSTNNNHYNGMSFAEFMASQQRGKQCGAPTATRYPPEKTRSRGPPTPKKCVAPVLPRRSLFLPSATSRCSAQPVRVCVYA